MDEIPSAAIVLPLFAAVGCILLACPLLLNIQARNLPATVLISGVIILNLLNVVNPIIWPTRNTDIWWDGRVLCDIEVRLDIAIGLAILGSAACISCRMALILDPDGNTLLMSLTRKGRLLLFDVTMCFILPCLKTGLHFFVQPYRYWIFQVTGCTAAVNTSWLGFLLVHSWTLLVAGTAMSYSTIALWRLKRLYSELSKIMEQTVPEWDRSHFLRIFGLANAILLANTAVTLTMICRYETFNPLGSTNSSVSLGWSKQIAYHVTEGAVTVDQIAQTIAAYVIFALLGFGTKARSAYCQWTARLGFGRSTKKVEAKTWEEGSSCSDC